VCKRKKRRGTNVGMSENELSESRIEGVSANSVTGRENQVGRGSVPTHPNTKAYQNRISKALQLYLPLLRIADGRGVRSIQSASSLSSAFCSRRCTHMVYPAATISEPGRRTSSMVPLDPGRCRKKGRKEIRSARVRSS